MTRQEANFKILEMLYQYVETYPDQRFGQILTNLDIASHLKDRLYTSGPFKNQWALSDIFFEESEDILERVAKEFQDQMIVPHEPVDEFSPLDTED